MSERLPLEVHFTASPCCGQPQSFWTTVDGYPIERCRECGSAFINPRPTAETLYEYYSEGGHGQATARSVDEVLQGEERYPNSVVDARRIIARIEELAPGSRMLDVGSGYGFFVREAKNRGFTVDALEISAFERGCSQELAGVDPIPVPFEEFEEDEGAYDAILMSQILEHAVDVRGWIAKAARFLTSQGVLAIALPNFNSFVRLLIGPRDPMVKPPDHLNFFNRTGLCRLLRAHGMVVEDVHTISRFPGSALTDRVAVPAGLSRPLERAVQTFQRPVLKPVDFLGIGMFLNVFALKRQVE